MAGNGLIILRKYMVNYFPKSKMAAKSVLAVKWHILELYNILLAFWNLIDVQIDNSVDAALSPLRDFSIKQNPKWLPSESISSRYDIM